MAKGRNIRRIEWDGKMLTVAEVAEILKLSMPVVQGMYSKGYTCKETILAYRKTLEGRSKNNGGGMEEKVYRTSKGDMTIGQMIAAHPHGLSRETIYYRGRSHGFSNPYLWEEKGARCDTTIEDGQVGEIDTLPIVQHQNINRLKCCCRNKGTEKCATYAERLKMDDDVPELCKAASGDYCPNYNGKDIEVHTNSSGRGIKHYAPNGTIMNLR